MGTIVQPGIARAHGQRAGDTSINAENFGRIAEGARRPLPCMAGGSGHTVDFGGRMVTMPLPEDVSGVVLLKDLELGISEWNHAEKKVTVNCGWLTHLPRPAVAIEETEVSVPGGSDTSPLWVYLEYNPALGTCIVAPTAAAGTFPPASSDGLFRLWLYRLYSISTGVYHPEKAWISRSVTLGAIFAG